MRIPLKIWPCMISGIFCLFLLSLHLQPSHAILYENGTCTNENLTKSANQVINTSGTVDDFLKSLPSDNIMLAEIICQSNSNDTIVK